MFADDLTARLLWGSLALLPATLVILFMKRPEVELFSHGYVRFLTERWKLITFLIAGGFVTLAGPYTSDPTWDRTNGGLMSLFTYLLAPWSVGALHRILLRKKSFLLLIPIAGFWFLAVVWSYDFYLYCRDGFFPEASWENFFASGALFVAAGLFWNLEESKDGISLSFLHGDWPARRNSSFQKLFWIALPLMLLAVLLTLPLLLEGQR